MGAGEPTEDPAQLNADDFVAVEVDGQRVYLAVRRTGPVARVSAPGEEQEIAGRRVGKPKLEQLLDGLGVFAQEIAGRLRDTDASRVTVQFGCEVAVESGQLVAMIGKISSASSITVSLEWTRPVP
jgi:hypothetical protein